MVESHCSNFRVITAIFRMSEYLGFFRVRVCHYLFSFPLSVIGRLWFNACCPSFASPFFFLDSFRAVFSFVPEFRSSNPLF